VERPERQRLALDPSVSDGAFARALDPESPVDPGIVRAVRILWAAGVEAFESCRGGEGHGLPEPVVMFHGGREAGWRAVAAAQEMDLPLLALRRYWTIIDGEPTGPSWQVVFRPMAD